jgi:hypothetical protein
MVSSTEISGLLRTGSGNSTYMKKSTLVFCFFFLSIGARAQLKYIVEDFEGFCNGTADLKTNGVFSFGNQAAGIESKRSLNKGYSGKRYLQLRKGDTPAYGGWGKGLCVNVELEPEADDLNFYFLQSGPPAETKIVVALQDDDNSDDVFTKECDDEWHSELTLNGKDSWALVSIPLSGFKDSNKGGDGAFNISYKSGKLISIIFTFLNSAKPVQGQSLCFDMLCFSKGPLRTGDSIFDPPQGWKEDHCSLGAWSKEGNSANFCEIATSIENIFGTQKKLGVVHFFQPFAVDGGSKQNFYPSIEKINAVVTQGYIPMITLEDHFAFLSPGEKQPNLYSIIEGHFDTFFAAWAKEIGQVKGEVLLRILHEFNGDWYPWCTVNNDQNPELIIKAYRHIHDIFKKQGVTNVKFIWCPNSMSIPQTKWNFIMDAYPGDEYVDIVGLDIYNGAGKSVAWRSFRKEGIENYFILTQQAAKKPLIVCEVASREREPDECRDAQNKAEWIAEMSEALQSDMSKVVLLTWFNEKKTFKINTSQASREAFLKYIWGNEHFSSGNGHMKWVIGEK